MKVSHRVIMDMKKKKNQRIRQYLLINMKEGFLLTFVEIII